MSKLAPRVRDVTLTQAKPKASLEPAELLAHHGQPRTGSASARRNVSSAITAASFQFTRLRQAKPKYLRALSSEQKKIEIPLMLRLDQTPNVRYVARDR
jgi:hypothetical protein